MFKRGGDQFTAAVSKILVAQNSHSISIKGLLGLLININVSRMTSQGAGLLEIETRFLLWAQRLPAQGQGPSLKRL